MAALAAGIPKLDDANDAGGRNSHMCTLILTEGDSAKTLAISGLSVVGRNHYGVFPLRWGGRQWGAGVGAHGHVSRLQVHPPACATDHAARGCHAGASC